MLFFTSGDQHFSHIKYLYIFWVYIYVYTLSLADWFFIHRLLGLRRGSSSVADDLVWQSVRSQITELVLLK